MPKTLSRGKTAIRRSLVTLITGRKAVRYQVANQTLFGRGCALKAMSCALKARRRVIYG